MATPKKSAAKDDWKPTFRKLESMTEGEKSAYYQGKKTARNMVKERLGFRPAYDSKS